MSESRRYLDDVLRRGGRVHTSNDLQSLAEAQASATGPTGDESPALAGRLARLYTERRQRSRSERDEPSAAVTEGLITFAQAEHLSGKTAKALRHYLGNRLTEIRLGGTTYLHEEEVRALARPEGYLSLAELAEKEGISLHALHDRLKRGAWSDLPSIRHGRDRLVKEADFEALKKARAAA